MSSCNVRLFSLASQASDRELEYPLAITCFNLSHMAVVYFDLFEGETTSPVADASQVEFRLCCASCGTSISESLWLCACFAADCHCRLTLVCLYSSRP